MRWLLRKCTVCGKYTLNQERCPYCGGMVKVPHPPKFSPQDRFVAYRYMIKYEVKSFKHVIGKE
ncbi:MAG: RNA-protein complex protein Nop10 [Caldisphaera sp.]|jgi:H/ACA ribonucleoprotein complex subunit 3|nr:RNA-protein complex protein Nop10 [Caldisphaera sp.]PMP59423.1 MAG: ribosome biogenesis protein [Caldisphaera sp.]